jgi:prepilin-type N-terminal cleavage/methylation domain-containing protein
MTIYCQKFNKEKLFIPGNLVINGFTLIELLLVMAIVGVLSSFVITASANYPKQARDAQRKSDINQYRIALETYATKNSGVYPKVTDDEIMWGSSLCSLLMNNGAIKDCPTDPLFTLADMSKVYHYNSTNGVIYILWAKLEKKEGSNFVYWYFCSTGFSGETNGAGLPTVGWCW